MTSTTSMQERHHGRRRFSDRLGTLQSVRPPKARDCISQSLRGRLRSREAVTGLFETMTAEQIEDALDFDGTVILGAGKD